MMANQIIHISIYEACPPCSVWDNVQPSNVDMAPSSRTAHNGGSLCQTGLLSAQPLRCTLGITQKIMAADIQCKGHQVIKPHAAIITALISLNQTEDGVKFNVKIQLTTVTIKTCNTARLLLILVPS